MAQHDEVTRLDMLKTKIYFFNIMNRSDAYGKHAGDVLRRIRTASRQWGGAFTPSDFADLGDPRSVGVVLSRLVAKGSIRRVRRGVYEVPSSHPLLGTVGAGPQAVTDAIVRRDALKLLPSGAHAANMLGLSTQVAARAAYGVAGRSRTEQTGGQAVVEFRRRSPKAMATAGRASGWLAEALRNIGREHVTSARLSPLKDKLGPKDRRQLREDIRYVPAWMRPAFEEVAGHG